MPKMKTKKALRGRIKVTARGKLLRHRAGRRHLQVRKNAKRRRQLRQATTVVGGHWSTYRNLLSPGL